MPRDLAECISTAARRPYEGSAFRQQSPRHDPLSGDGARILGGRFNPPESFPVLYLCTTRACAVAEAIRETPSDRTGVDAVLAVFTDNLRSGRLEPRIAERWESLADL
jgi:RES domain-containing protein